MNTRIIFGILSFLLITGNVSSQTIEKYEFAVLSYSTHAKNITISTDAPSYKIIEVTEKIKLDDRNFTPILVEVKRMQDEGWELFDTETSGHGVFGSPDLNVPDYVFYMRRKK